MIFISDLQREDIKINFRFRSGEFFITDLQMFMLEFNTSTGRARFLFPPCETSFKK